MYSQLRLNSIRLAAFAIVSGILVSEASTHDFLARTAIAVAYFSVTAFSILMTSRNPETRLPTYVQIISDAVLVGVVLYGHLLGPSSSDNHELSAAGLAIPFVLLMQVSMRLRMREILVFLALVTTTWLVILAVLAVRHSGTGVSGALLDFVNQDLVLAGSFGFAGLASIVLAKEYRSTQVWGRKADNLRQTLLRFFSPGIASSIQFEELPQSLKKRKVAVMFVDMRGFTSLCEHQDPKTLAKLLSEYRDIVSTSVHPHGGSVEKFLGDGILVVFGVSNPSDSDAGKALASAIQLVRDLSSWRDECRARGLPEICTGIGLHYGFAVCGIISTRLQDDWTVLGDTVNIAQRLERMAKVNNAQLVVSSLLISCARHSFDELPWVRVHSAKLPGSDRLMDFVYLPYVC